MPLIIPPTNAPSPAQRNARPHPRLALVVAARDEQEELPGCLAAAAPFLAAGDALVLADDGSRDATAELARAVGADVLATGGVGRARAYAAAVARALEASPPPDALLLLQADTWLAPDARDAIVAAAGRAARPGEAPGEGARRLLGFFGQHIRSPRRTFRLVERANAARARILGLAYGDQAPVVGLDVLARAGGFPDVARHEDLELALRLRRAGARWTRLPATVSIGARHWERGLARTLAADLAAVVRHLASRRGASRLSTGDADPQDRPRR